METISFNEIKALFSDTSLWHVGYLDTNDIQILHNFGIKFSGIEVHYDYENAIIVTKNTNSFDYSVFKDVKEKINSLNKPIIYHNWETINLKFALVLAGMGQYGKNQLVYDDLFGFDIHISVLLIKNKITDLPARKTPNWNFLPQCDGCTDCFNACPVQAIHNQESPYWIDLQKCDNFCHWGNHDTIPSMKWTWGKYVLKPPVSKELLYQITNFDTEYEILNIPFERAFIKDGKEVFVKHPVCRECCSQPKCSKYNGHFPYKPEEIEFYE